jgi:DNA helicase-2/ATP-dependent DNA helicase PcrA
MSPLLDGLNQEQFEAVTHGQGPLLVIAGAGSGKTRVLTRRIAYLIEEESIHPSQILAITFTNKAAAEMRARVADLIGPEAKGMWVSTFHSACVRILRSHGEALGYGKNFAIYDSDDSEKLISLVIGSLGLDSKRFPARGMAGQISSAKSELVSPAKLADRASHIMERRVAEVYRIYEERLKAANAMDFDDLIVNTYRLFAEHPGVLDYYQRRFVHLLVDEYQDTNVAQNGLVMALGDKSRNVFVVGDSDQSVYGFRGADMRNILEFSKNFDDAKVIKLEQNYRSTQNILKVANAIIAQNSNRLEKNLWSDQGDGDKVKMFVGSDQDEEANFVATTIQKENAQGIRFGDMAVFYRINSNSRSIEEALIRRSIPYRVVGGTRFYDRKEIRDAVSYLRLLVNPNDEMSLRRVCNTPKRGVGDASVLRVFEFSQSQSVPAFEAFRRASEAGVSGRALTGIASFIKLIDDLTKLVADQAPPIAIIEQFLEKSGYREELSASGQVDDLARLDNITELIGVASEHQSLEEFLDSVALVAQADQIKDDNVVTLMTVHTAKGLEFDLVFLTAFEDGIFPHSRSLYDESELEEERRLCYVAVTRARKKLFVTRASKRFVFGSESASVPSRFIDEFPPTLIEDVSQPKSYDELRSRYFDRNRDTDSDRNSTSSGISPNQLAKFSQRQSNQGPRLEPSQVKVGVKVVHGSWGEGFVEEVSGSGSSMTAVIRFRGLGAKKVMISHAPLKLA